MAEPEKRGRPLPDVVIDLRTGAVAWGNSDQGDRAMAGRYEGGCMCGAVRYVAEGEPVNERICHCRSCQRAIGAAFNARLLFRAAAVTLTGSVKTANSSPEVQRGFCAECGTTVFSGRQSAGIMGLTSGSLDDPALFRPTMHIWTSSRQPWMVLDDGLPQHEEAAPA